MDSQEVLAGLNFGRVDAESDSRFESCFIGTEMLRQALLPQHSLILGSKGSGKSAAFRLLSQHQEKVRPVFPKGFNEIFCIPVYGLQNEDASPGIELRDIRSGSIDDFRYFWLLFIGLKTVTALVHDSKLQALVGSHPSPTLKSAFETVERVLDDLELSRGRSGISRLKQKLGSLIKNTDKPVIAQAEDFNRVLMMDFKHRTGMSVGAMLDQVDTILRETNSLAWVLLDKLDLLYMDDFEQLRAAVTGLVQVLVEHSNRFKNIHFKIFLRNDIYRQLRIVNKSHLVSYTTEMRWREVLLLKLLVSRAIADATVRSYCEEVTGEKIDVATIINGTEEDVLSIFYILFEATMGDSTMDSNVPFTHVWLLRHLTDGMGNVYPREVIHLGNLAVEKQRDLNRQEGCHASTRLISSRALREAFAQVSVYRCDTYLYAEFPHLENHFNVFRGSDKATFTRDELVERFKDFTPNGDDAIRAIYDAGLITPLGRTVDSSMEFRVPLLYRIGLGISQRGAMIRSVPRSQPVVSPGDLLFSEI
jgi:hypothetical protein